MAEVQWYYAHHNQQYGPVSAGELKQLAEAGRLTPEDLLWREGMDAWTTAVNLRGLFDSEPASAAKSPSSVTAPTATASAASRPQTPERSTPAHRTPLRALLRATQTILWTLCVLVVLIGVVLFTRAFLQAESPDREATAAAVFATFLLAAYVLARAGEKLSRLLLGIARRRSR
jgi:hypothetical protein